MKNVKTYLMLLSTVAFSTIYGQNKKIMNISKTKHTTVLDIRPSATSSANDFDFLQGQWQVHNRKLKTRLNNCKEWDEFESELHMKKALNGLGNVENYYATFNNEPFEGMAVRLFNSQTKLWTIYWIDSSTTKMDEHPVTGSFENGIGQFYTRDLFNGIPIVVIYQWDTTNPEHPSWSQAFSIDDGKTWEWNWEMTLTKIK